MDKEYFFLRMRSPSPRAVETRNELVVSSNFPPLLQLPSELLDRILTYLQANDLSRLGRTCTYLNSLCSNQVLWRRLTLLDSFYLPPPLSTSSSDLISTESFTKATYLKIFQEFKERQTRRFKLESEERAKVARSAQRKKLHRLCDVFTYRLFLVLLCACIISSMALVCNHAGIGVVLIPVWVMFFYVFCNGIAAMLLYRFQDKRDSIWLELWDLDSSVPVIFIKETSPIFHYRIRFQVLYQVVMFCLFLLFFLLVSFNLQHGETIMFWSLVFVPFWIVCLMVLVIMFPPLSPIAIDSDMEVVYVVVWFLLLPLFLTSILVPAFLDTNSNWGSFAWPLLPLFAQDVLFFIVMIFQGVYYTYKDRSQLRETCVVSIFFTIFSLPFILFEIFVVQYVDYGPGAISLVEVFSPLFVWFSLYMGFVLIFYCVREDVFREAGPIMPVLNRLQRGENDNFDLGGENNNFDVWHNGVLPDFMPMDDDLQLGHEFQEMQLEIARMIQEIQDQEHHLELLALPPSPPPVPNGEMDLV